jgi:hypothetical protein
VNECKPLDAGSQNQWELWVELYSAEYHASPAGAYTRPLLSST